jgi:hypothetical protein
MLTETTPSSHVALDLQSTPGACGPWSAASDSSLASYLPAGTDTLAGLGSVLPHGALPVCSGSDLSASHQPLHAGVCRGRVGGSAYWRTPRIQRTPISLPL